MNKLAIALIVVSLFGCSKKEEPVQQTVLFATPNGIVDQHGRPVIIQNAGGQWAGQQQAQMSAGQEQQLAPAQAVPQMPYAPQQYQVQPPVHTTMPTDNSGLTTGEVVGAAALAAAAGAAGYMAGKNKNAETVRPQEPSAYQRNIDERRPVPQAPTTKSTSVVEQTAKPKIESNMVPSGPSMSSLPSMKSQVPVTQVAAPTAYAQQQGVPNKPVQAAPVVKPSPAPTQTFKSAPITMPQVQSPSRWSSAPAAPTVSRSFSSGSSSSYSGSGSRR